jgi:CBS domain-containing protein
MTIGKKVRDVMTRDVECARPDMSITDVSKKMKDLDIGSLLICEAEKLVGILTDRDITIRVIAEGRNPEDTMVGDVMSKDPATVGEDDTLERAENLMHDRQVRRLPVVDADRRLVGYLATATLARAEDEETVGHVFKGISERAQPKPMGAALRGKRRKTG